MTVLEKTDMNVTDIIAARIGRPVSHVPPTDQLYVVKYGGHVSDGKAFQDIALMHSMGIQCVVVHGGGPAINEALAQRGKEPVFNEGLRVTDDETLEVVEMILAGSMNKKLVGALQRCGAAALGLSGKDMDLLMAERKTNNGVDIGWVGKITQVNTDFIHQLLALDIIPVIAPVGTDKSGQGYNINADEAATVIAGALEADKLLFMTDVPGVLADVNNRDSLISTLTVEETQALIQQGVISGGMIPKVNAALDGIEAGVGSVHILDGQQPHVLLSEIFTEDGVGTMFLESKA